MRDGSQWRGVAASKGASHSRGVPRDRGVATPKMADDKGPAREKATEMMKISMKMANGGLPQGTRDPWVLTLC